MSKGKLIAILLAIFIIVGTASFVMGAVGMKHTSIKPLNAAATSSEANKFYTGTITYLGPWTNSDENIVHIKVGTVTHYLVLIPGKGELGQDCWITLNGAMTANVPVSVATDSNGYINEVDWTR